MDDALIITCEHGGCEVPALYAPLFAGHEALLQTHRGWDPGALVLARELAGALKAPLFFATTTRLLIDLNRSIGHPQLHSEITRGLPLAMRRDIEARHYQPHRDIVEAEVARLIAAGRRVVLLDRGRLGSGASSRKRRNRLRHRPNFIPAWVRSTTPSPPKIPKRRNILTRA